jgi:hypothetical protein
LLAPFGHKQQPPPVPGSYVVDPGLLLGYQTLHIFGPFFLVGLNTFA